MAFTTSSYFLQNRCPDGTPTTDCIQYVGVAIPCLNICTGDTLTSLECTIANTLCTLVGEVNMSSVIIPSCFTTAFITGDITIQNFLQVLLDNACLQQINLTALQVQVSTLDPILNISYPNCGNGSCLSCIPSTCGSGTVVSVSQHITNILNCLCGIYCLLGHLPTGYTSFGCGLGNLQTILNSQQGLLVAQANAINAIVATFNASVCSNGNTLIGVPVAASPPLTFSC